MKKKSTSQPVRRPVLRSSSATEGGSSWLAIIFKRRRLREGGPDLRSFSEGGPDLRSFSEGGFFTLRVVIGVFLVLASVLLALIGFGAFSNASAQANAGNTSSAAQQDEQPVGQQFGQMTVIPAVHSDLSPPLREQPVEWPRAREEREPPVNPRIPFRYKGGPDPVIQSSFGQALISSAAIPAPIHTWAGMSKPCNGCTPSIPPDTNGAVGKTQYLEMVNVGFQVFDKLTGTSLLGPIPIDSIWFGFRDACRTGGAGDPVVVYDRLADRWVISQFAMPTESGFVSDECIAVSQTGDATGAWYRYDFHVTRLFADYPKFGVWPDGYYMSANMFGRRGFLGPQAFVFDRAKMLVGDPTATVQTPGRINDEHPLLPSDLDGILPPPPGDPNHFVEVTVEENGPPDEQALAGPVATPTPTATPAPKYKVWAFHVDWDHPANSRFSPEANLPAAGFSVLCPDTRDCVPQKGTEAKLDAIADRLMFRNPYRRFPDGRESMLDNITVNAESVAGIRWFELQRALPGKWAIHQQNTYRPDNTWRWMGSIASDNQGNIALGFSASSATIYPQIRYAGRLATDPLNMLSSEQHLFDGTGSQLSQFSRWGDYSDMTIDPVDDCTFYYTNEYYATTTEARWQTRIGYFRFSECTSPQKGTAHFVVCDRGAPLSKALVLIDGRTYGATLADGTYDAMLPPGSHTYTVSNPAFATQRGSFTITNGQTTLVDLCPNPRSTLANISARAFVQTGDNVMIGGFMVQGTEPKRVIIRAIGPDLTQYGVPDALANPTLELHDGTGALIASNNNWMTTIIGGIITSNQVHEIQASGYAPGNPLDSAIIADLPAGNYTAIVRGVNNLTGVALVEVYSLQ